MRTATVRDLRNNFKKISAWIDNGEEVQITKNGKPYASLNPQKPKKPVAWPDITTRHKALFGDKVYSAEEAAAAIAATRGTRS